MAAYHTKLRRLYRHSFHEPRRERLFLASLGFFAAYGITRAISHAIRAGLVPWHSVFIGQTHVHHLVWGILLLLVVGYGWLVQLGTGKGDSSRWLGRLMAVLYGVGAALTLDEFALWLHLEDVYWEREGRASVDAVLIFGALVSSGVWGGPFLRASGREVGRRLGLRHHLHGHPAAEGPGPGPAPAPAGRPPREVP